MLEDYNLKEKLGYFVFNNADNNNKCVEYILKKMRPELEFYKYRFRCFGYILNLIAQAFLFGTDPDCLAADFFNEDDDPNDYTRKLKKWRERGPVGKLYNLVTYIRRTPIRIAEYR